MESALRRLDRHRYRHLQLWPTDDPSRHDANPGSRDFLAVIGGNGAYFVNVSSSDGSESFLWFAAPPNREVIVLPGTDGFLDGAWTAPASRVCRDVEIVIQAVRHYAEHGGLDPSLNWERLS
jgi:hypothetical protein